MENKENILKKIKNDSMNEFENYVPVMEDDVKIKEIFYYFLYNDLIPIEINSKNEIDINNIINNPTFVVDEYLDNIYSKIMNSNNNLYEEFKKELVKKIISIKNKINECNSHIELIKKEYINIKLGKFLPINNTKKSFIFENKTILYLSKKNDYNLKLSEFFARNMFCSIEKKNNNTIDLKDLYDNFYDSNKINSYIDISNGNINKFENININFKYWIILIFLVGQIFSSKSKYYLIFNNDEFNKHVNLILHPKKDDKNPKKSKKNKKKKSHKGGDKSKNKISEFLKALTDKNNNKKENKKNPSEFYNHILKDTYIGNDSLKKIYYDSFNNNIKQYFSNNLTFARGEIKDIKTVNFVHPFADSINVKLEDIIENKTKFFIINNSSKSTILNNINFNLYQSLYLLLDRNNRDHLEKFIDEVKYKTILLLFYLYNIKLIIYNSFIEKINSIFNIKINNKNKSNKSASDKNASDKSINKSVPNKSAIDKSAINKSASNINNNVNNIDYKIKKKKNEIQSIKDDGIKDYNEKILLLESELKNLIIIKYNNKKSNL
jgi:hypothetical protein